MWTLHEADRRSTVGYLGTKYDAGRVATNEFKIRQERFKGSSSHPLQSQIAGRAERWPNTNARAVAEWELKTRAKPNRQFKVSKEWLPPVCASTIDEAG
jgi:hypothetical protein